MSPARRNETNKTRVDVYSDGGTGNKRKRKKEKKERNGVSTIPTLAMYSYKFPQPTCLVSTPGPFSSMKCGVTQVLGSEIWYVAQAKILVSEVFQVRFCFPCNSSGGTELHMRVSINVDHASAACLY